MNKTKFSIKENIAILSDGRSVQISCKTCIHKNRTMSCAAYPNGIPMSIISGQKLHTSSVWNDNGITYEPKFPDMEK